MDGETGITDGGEGGEGPSWPDRLDRMDALLVDGTHPSLLSNEHLLSQCDLRTQRRSGPGGQHRNKTSSGVFLHHGQTQIVGEATERRSQADNRAVALQRLRYRLAVEVRTSPICDGPVPTVESELRDRFRGTPLKINDRNDAKPAVLACLLNDLHASGGQPSLVAPLWATTTSAIVRLVKSHPPAFQLLGAIRKHHGRRGLK